VPVLISGSVVLYLLQDPGILDNAPALAGHQHYFMFLTGIMVMGLLAVTLLIRLNRRLAMN